MTISPANITIDDNGNIRSNDFNDVYFMPEKGIDESKYVFIEPSNFTDKPTTVLEFGFGTGLNFLLTLDKFKRNLNNLHFISIEKHPVLKSDLEKIYKFLPDYLQNLCTELLNNYPDIIQGKHQLNISGAKLTLHFDEINDCITSINDNIDCIYLDGFAPNKNSAMWGENLFNHCYKILNNNGMVNTFSASSIVAKGLESAGFFVNKRDGFGNKRECLIATKSLFNIPDNIKSIAIVGAGITGCCLAYELNKAGYNINLYDKNDKPMTATSGNPFALLDPRFINNDGYEYEFNKNSYLYAINFYKQLNTFAVVGLTKFETDKVDKDRMNTWVNTQNIDKQDMTENNNGNYSLNFATGGALDTQQVAKELTANINFVQKQITDTNELSEDLIFICLGAETNELAPDIPQTINRGCIGITTALLNENKAISKDGYFINSTDKDICVIGSQFARVKNITNTKQNINDLNAIIQKASPIINISKDQDITLRYGHRSHTKYRIPSIKQINDKTLCVLGMGARGFINAPYIAHIIKCVAFDNNHIASHKLLKALTKT
ncbi:MAG: tRNA (5-methylaminomethyl-2-thiouridine)(34)-methyltransferase MnmD [Alphaproteobacteria bacterium]